MAGSAGTVLVDAGPLVALINSRERHHAWAMATVAGFTEPMVTCDAVLSEAFYLLSKKTADGARKLCAMLDRGLVVSDFDLGKHRAAVTALLQKYRDTPMSFADACLVVMVEGRTGAKVFTLDSDFRIYRQSNRRVIPLISPEG